MPPFRLLNDDETCAEFNLQPDALRHYKALAAVAIRDDNRAALSREWREARANIAAFARNLPYAFCGCLLSCCKCLWSLLCKIKWLVVILVSLLLMTASCALIPEMEALACRSLTVSRMSWWWGSILGTDPCAQQKEFEQMRTAQISALSHDCNLARKSYEQLANSDITVTGLQDRAQAIVAQSDQLERTLQDSAAAVFNSKALAAQAHLVTEAFRAQRVPRTLANINAYQSVTSKSAKSLRHRLSNYSSWAEAHWVWATVIVLSGDLFPPLQAYQTKRSLEHDTWSFFTKLLAQSSAHDTNISRLIEDATAAEQHLVRLERMVNNSHKEYLCTCRAYIDMESRSGLNPLDWPALWIHGRDASYANTPPICQVSNPDQHRSTVENLLKIVRTIKSHAEKLKAHLNGAYNNVGALMAKSEQAMTLELIVPGSIDVDDAGTVQPVQQQGRIPLQSGIDPGLVLPDLDALLGHIEGVPREPSERGRVAIRSNEKIDM